MHRHFHVLAIALVGLLAIAGWTSPSGQPFVPPVRAQVVTPDPSPPSFENQQFVIVSDNTTNPGGDNRPTFATGELADPSAYPVTTVRVRNHQGDLNEQRFWLSVRVRQQDAGVEVTAEPGYAQMGLIAPGGEAAYTLTFPGTPSARVEFEVDGSTDEAVMLTLLQFALEAGFAAADLTGFGGHDAEIGGELAEVVAEQYLADLPTFVPCANAVAAVQRGIDDQEQFERDLQDCLESPIWQTSVDQVLTRLAERDWFNQAVNAAGLMMPAVSTAVRSVESAQFAAQLWTMYDKFHPEVPGATVGTVAFLSVDTTDRETLGAATAVPDISVYEVVGRAQAAVQQAGTYKYERVTLDESGEQSYAQSGEVVIGGGRKFQAPDDISWTYVDESGKFYNQQEDGTWSSNYPGGGPVADPMTEFLGTPVTDWSLLGVESTEGRSAYLIERDATEIHGAIEYRYHESYWVDAETFFPLKQFSKNEEQEQTSAATEIRFFDFGAPVDVEVPSEAFEPTPTPEPPPTLAPEVFDPEALIYHLWLTPFPDGELPPGYFGAELTVLSSNQMQQFAEFGIAGAVAGLTVQIPSGDQGNQIDYVAFPTADAARQAFDAAQAAMPRRGLAWVGGCTPTQANGGTLFSGYLEAATSVCVSWVGNVLVLGSSVMPGFAEDQTMTNATDLARSGVVHLGLLLTNDPPPAVPSLPGGTGDIVEVRGPGGMQDTGVYVGQGATVVVRYLSGVWSTLDEFQNAPITAAGDPYLPPDFQGGVISFPYGALIGRVGDGAQFGVGMGLTFQAERDGMLFLGMNDDDTSDNSGGIRVAVAVGPSVGTEATPSDSADGQSETREAVVEVLATQAWTDTGIDISPGVSVEISASGRIQIAGSDPGKYPDGRTSDSEIPGTDCITSENWDWVTEGAACWSLIGRIGDGAPFPVGSSTRFDAATEGRLYLGVNDAEFGDNRGSWSATVTVWAD